MKSYNNEMKEIVFSLRAKSLNTRIIDVENISICNASSSITNCPHYILKGSQCSYYKNNLCTPCYWDNYSSFHVSETESFDMISRQIEKLFNELEDEAIKCKTDERNGRLEVTITPFGSFFDNSEISPKQRMSIFTRCILIMKKYAISIRLNVKSHAENIIELFESGFDEIEYMKDIDVNVLLNFESTNAILRNGLYCKELDLDNFMKAAKLLKQHKFRVSAFVTASLLPMNDRESLDMTIESLVYLKNNQIKPIIMFNNIDQYSLQECLWENPKNRLIEPKTMYEIVSKMIEIFSDGYYEEWYLTDPLFFEIDTDNGLFTNSRKVTCDACSQKIYKSISELRKNRNVSDFRKYRFELQNCECEEEYLKLLEAQKFDRNLSDRIAIEINNINNVLKKNKFIIGGEK